jgi:O-antigen/teichoic acid export membrane protein
LWKKYAMGVLVVSAVYALGTRLAGQSIVHILYEGKYDGLGRYLFALTFVPLILWLGTTISHALNAMEKPKFQFWAYVCSGTCTFAVGIPLVIRLGLWGAVYGMLVSGTSYTLALAFSFAVSFFRLPTEVKRMGLGSHAGVDAHV